MLFLFLKSRFFCTEFLIRNLWHREFQDLECHWFGPFGEKSVGEFGLVLWHFGVFFVAFCFFFKMLVHFEPPFYVFCGGRCCKSLFFPLMKCKLLGDAEFRFARTLHGPFQ